MSELVEVLITSDSEANHCTCTAWDPRTGTSVMVYKGGGAASLHGLSMITDRFIVTANSTKPLIHVWATNSQEQINGVRYVAPGKVNALAISSDGNFLIAAVQETIYIWQICSGKLLNVISKHFQTITTIKFTDDNSHFVSAGQDGAVLVWNLTKSVSGNQQPFYNLNDHALPVTDIFIGRGGLRTILCTASLDRSCRYYDLLTGNLLLNLVHDEGLTAVCLNILENDAFVGTVTGVIYHYYLNNPPRMREYHLEKDDYDNRFIGHNGKAVTCLDLSLDGKTLVSGGQDHNVYLWDITSKQLLRTIAHKGSITNLKFILCGKNMFNAELNFTLITGNLKRMKDNEENSKEDIIELLISDNTVDDSDDDDLQDYKKNISVGSSSNSSHITNSSCNQYDELKRLRQENEHLRKINKSLYEFSINKILSKKTNVNNEINGDE